MAFSMMMLTTGCGGNDEPAEEPAEEPVDDAAAAAAVDEMIAAIQVQERTDETDAQCEAAKAAWDALTDAQKELVEEGGYFADDTGDASADDPLNQDEIGENEILVVSFGTSFNDSRATDIGGIEKAIQAANPDWSVRRAFTAQIIINHVQARDGEKIDNMEQALQRAIDNGVMNLVIQPTHLMHGAEYDELVAAVEAVKDQFDSVKIAEPLLGEVGADATQINADKETAAKAMVAEAVKVAGADSLDALAADGTAIVFMGHGTSHAAAVTYSQMQAQMQQLGYKNVFVGTVEGNPAETALPEVKKAVEAAGYTKVILRPMMVVAGDHANNDMAADEEGTWYYGFVNGGEFEVEGADEPVDIGAGFGAENVTCQIEGLGRIADIQAMYVAHTAAVM
ncbi:MAG: sirohydrochlorin cobaltochelatase [Firmicutes bacterium]|nr:sirohydrochlorin cobaltochelatase [Bacillota bacterium]